MKRHLTKENIPMANKSLKRCSTSWINREMKLKWQWDTVRMAKTKKIDDTTYWQWSRENGNLISCFWECKMIQLLWENLVVSQYI